MLAGEPHTYLNHPGSAAQQRDAAVRRLARTSVRRSTLRSIILAGRSLVAVVGSLTVLPTAALAQMLFGRARASSPAQCSRSHRSYLHSRYLKEDVYLAFGSWSRYGRWRAGSRDAGAAHRRRRVAPLGRLALGSAGLALGRSTSGSSPSCSRSRSGGARAAPPGGAPPRRRWPRSSAPGPGRRRSSSPPWRGDAAAFTSSAGR